MAWVINDATVADAILDRPGPQRLPAEAGGRIHSQKQSEPEGLTASFGLKQSKSLGGAAAEHAHPPMGPRRTT